jgi:hypothetical protein
MSIAFESSALFIRKHYYKIQKFNRTARYEMHTNEVMNNILSFVKDVENRVVERRSILGDIREYRTWLLKSYKL